MRLEGFQIRVCRIWRPASTIMTNLRAAPGYAFVELLFVMGLAMTIAGIAAPGILAGLDDLKTLGGVRYISARLQRTRMEAVSRGVNVAIRFTATGASYSYSIYADGDGDGVRSEDIQRGIDEPLGRDERLPEQFPGVDFATLPGLPAVDMSSTAPGSDPLALGASNMVAFTPLGTSTPGSLYILGPRGTQYVVRVFAETGKTRILRFDAHARRWEGL